MTKNIDALLEALSEMTDEELRVAGNAIRRTVEKTKKKNETARQHEAASKFAIGDIVRYETVLSGTTEEGPITDISDKAIMVYCAAKERSYPVLPTKVRFAV
jgi:hypothetical protein